MNKRLRWVSLLTLACLVISSLLWIKPGVQSVFALSAAKYGGFLYPWAYDSTHRMKLTTNSHDGNTEGGALDFANGTNFDILAPKDGVVLYANDDAPDDWSGQCSGYDAASNYVVLGHGYLTNGIYSHYSVYYHLKQASIPSSVKQTGHPVRLGEKIGQAGNTGDSSGIHLHMWVTNKPVEFKPASRVYNCAGEFRGLHDWVKDSFSDRVSFGFEEYQDKWPLLNGQGGLATYLEDPQNGKPGSYNAQGIQPNACDSRTDSVILYEHIDYGGPCVVVPNPEQGFVVPSGMQISSIRLNTNWLISGNVAHTLTLWDKVNHTSNDPSRTIVQSEPNLALVLGGWNDRVKYVHNAAHLNIPWLLEESYAPHEPLDVNLHFKVTIDSDLDAWRVCIDHDGCQEKSGGINEIFYTWHTYLYPDGDHTISVEYRRTSDNQNWALADKYEVSYYLSPNRSSYAPCNMGFNGAQLVSGSDCIVATQNVGELAEVGWGDKSDLTVTAIGYDVLAYNSSWYQGQPYLIRSGQSQYLGGNVSSIDLRQLVTPYTPDSPLGVDEFTTHYYSLDETTGTTVYDTAGTLNGSLSGTASFTTGRFGGALSTVGNPIGGINFGAVDFGSGPLTIETFVKVNDASGGRIATQFGGNGNTGYLKWMLGVNSNRFRIQVCHTAGCFEAYSLEDISVGSWYYLMFTYNGDKTAKLYVNSVLQATITMDNVMSPGATTFEIGKGENISTFNGLIDDFRVSNTERVPLGPPAATATPMPTFTPAATNTATATSTFTPTATQASSSGTLTFTPVEDSILDSTAPDTNFGSGDTLSVDNSPVESMVMKFNVTGLSGKTVTSAKLRLFCWDDSVFGGNFYKVTTSWSESTVTYNTRPDYDGNTVYALNSAVSPGNWYEVDVTSLITGDGSYSIRGKSPNGDGADYSSREGSNPPELVITYSDGSTTATPTATATQASADTTLYNFEGGTLQGWSSADYISSVTNTTDRAYLGTHSMCAVTDFAGGGWHGGELFVEKDVSNDNLITARVYAPPDANIEAALYLQDVNWGWYESSFIGLTPGTWTTLTWDISTLGLTTSTIRIGVHLGSDYTYQGCVYLDSIDVGSGSGPTATPTMTPTSTPTQSSSDPTLYNFENGTVQNWGNADYITSLTNATDQAYAGTHSVCAAASFAGNGWAGGEIFVDKDVSTSNTITAHVYVPAGTDIAGALYLQDANWGWYESSFTGLTPGSWTTLTWDLSGLGFTTPTIRIGLHFGSNYSYQGCIYVDSIDVQ